MSEGGIDAVLRRVDRALTALGSEYALIGGLAVSVRAEPRFTRDADVAVATEDDAESERLIRALRQYDLVPFSVTEHEGIGRLAMARMRDSAGMVCNLMFANTGIEAEIVQTAERMEIAPGLFVPVATLECLVAMKVLSVSDGRPQDRMDLGGLLARQPDLDRVRELLGAIEAAGCHREQDLLGKLGVAIGAGAKR